LSERVDFACSNLTGELKGAAEKYREYAGWMSEAKMSPEQQGRAERRLLYGATELERRAGAHGLHQQLWLCAMSRADSARGEELATRAAVLTDKLTSPTGHAETASTVEALAGLAAEIKALPIRD